ncbi:DUF397 domain-containing protein [Streptomyces sp. NPDC037389]|uniref:DUF397 domain-containing protein n=1 Tax=Streptomyces sp. NPDC037389 TaxID=3155369 RepID=UPI0033F593A1
MGTNTHVSPIAGIAWIKSSYSASQSNCVEVGALGGSVAVQDSKAPRGSFLHLPKRAWREFVSGVKIEDPPA